MTLDTARGGNPSLRVRATFAFSPRIIGVVINRLSLVSVDGVEGLEGSDFDGCGFLGNLTAFIVDLASNTLSSFIADHVAAALNLNYCGAPGPELFTPCP